MKIFTTFANKDTKIYKPKILSISLKGMQNHSFFEQPNDYNEATIYRERPFFECYLDDL